MINFKFMIFESLMFFDVAVRYSLVYKIQQLMEWK